MKYESQTVSDLSPFSSAALSDLQLCHREDVRPPREFVVSRQVFWHSHIFQINPERWCWHVCGLFGLLFAKCLPNRHLSLVVIT